MQNINKDTVQGAWKELKGKMMQSWSKLTDDDFAGFKGNAEELKGKIQKLYGYTKEQVETEFEGWKQKHAKTLNEGVDKVNNKLDQKIDDLKTKKDTRNA